MGGPVWGRETLWIILVLVLCWPVMFPYVVRLRDRLWAGRQVRGGVEVAHPPPVGGALPESLTVSPGKVCLICREFLIGEAAAHRCDPDMLVVRMRMEDYGSVPWKNYVADAGRVVGRAVAVGLVVSLPGWAAWTVAGTLLVLQAAEMIVLHRHMGIVDVGKDLEGQLPDPSHVLSPGFALIAAHVERLRGQMGVGGVVLVIPNIPGLSASRKTFFAAALPLTENYSLLFLSGRVLDFPPRELSGIIAHELSHLKRPYRNTFLGVADGWAFPLAVMGALCFVPLFGFLGAVVWGVLLGWAVQLAVLMMRRAEERQADMEAYQVCGEDYRAALLRMLALYPHLSRKNLWWKAEDVFSSHNSVPNRWHHLA